mmetsp:Transcript_18316/g.47791  ORF Transcript_18316/g.47791 Transcript_18316/m.47791 type:complete len:257 (+) Transcript_18316:368-1138(+)
MMVIALGVDSSSSSSGGGSGGWRVWAMQGSGTRGGHASCGQGLLHVHAHMLQAVQLILPVEEAFLLCGPQQMLPHRVNCVGGPIEEGILHRCPCEEQIQPILGEIGMQPLSLLLHLTLHPAQHFCPLLLQQGACPPCTHTSHAPFTSEVVQPPLCSHGVGKVQEHYPSLLAAGPAKAAGLHPKHAGYLSQPELLVGQEQGDLPQLLLLVLEIRTTFHHPLHLEGGCGIRGAAVLLQRCDALLHVLILSPQSCTHLL